MTQQFVSELRRPVVDPDTSPFGDPSSPDFGDRRAQPGPSVAEVVDADALLSAIKKALAAKLRGDGGAVVVEPTAILARRLARYALAGDLSATTDCLRRAVDGRSRPALTVAPLLEAAAARCRSHWMKDRIPEIDVTVALCILQLALRSLCAQGSVLHHGARGVVLVATPQDEPHGLGAVLASEVLAEAEFDVLYRPAGSSEELVALLGSTWVDAVSLHASPVFGRRERLAALANLIGCVRAASRNRDLIVAAQGACFVESGRGDRDAVTIGADAAFPSSGSLLAWLSERLTRARTVASGRR